MSEEKLFLGMRSTCVAVRDVEKAAERLGRAFQAVPEATTQNSDDEVEARFSSIDIGAEQLVLMEDLTGKGPIARFIESRGEGLFSILVQVSDVKKAMAHMQSEGFSFVEPEPRPLDEQDENGNPIRVDVAWVHPKDSHGLLIELQQIHG
ncbi:MAG TPA: VOC family protein [Solirubrobacterales bacterium]|nr:VOC family protein [Solirubrobacterales bacterium]